MKWEDRILGKHIELNEDGKYIKHEGYTISKCSCGDEYPTTIGIRPRKNCGKEKCFKV